MFKNNDLIICKIHLLLLFLPHHPTTPSLRIHWSCALKNVSCTESCTPQDTWQMNTATKFFHILCPTVVLKILCVDFVCWHIFLGQLLRQVEFIGNHLRHIFLCSSPLFPLLNLFFWETLPPSQSSQYCCTMEQKFSPPPGFSKKNLPLFFGTNLDKFFEITI